MPPTTQKSSLFAKFGDRYKKAAAKAAAAPIDWGTQRLPGGIANGIARLTKAEFGKVAAGKQNAGMDYVRFTGVALEPEFVDVGGVRQPVAGGQTSIIEMLGDTASAAGEKTPFEDHVFNASNIMKMIANDQNFDTEDLEEAARTIVACCEDPVSGQPCGPCFRFTTRESPAVMQPDGVTVKYQAKVWEQWWGGKGLENYVPPEAASVQDETPPAEPLPSANGAKPPAKKPPQHTSRVAQAAPEPEETPAADTDYQLIELVEAASSDGDTDEEKSASADATDELTKLAVAAGWTKEEVQSAEGWDAVADMIRSPKDADAEQPADDEEPAADEPPADPVKGDAVMHQVKDAKGQPAKNPRTKKALPPIQCEVAAVDKKARTVTLRQAEDGKTLYKGVAWDDLLPVE